MYYDTFNKKFFVGVYDVSDALKDLIRQTLDDYVKTLSKDEFSKILEDLQNGKNPT